jgi:hypothetical protein
MQGLGLSGQNAKAFFIGLAGAEGTKAKNNPFAVSQPLGKGETKFNSHGVKNYRTAQDGIDATVSLFQLGYYKEVRRLLRADAPVDQTSKALARSPYVGGSQAVRDRHAANIARNARNTAYESPALSGNSEVLSAQGAPVTPSYKAQLAPGADRDGSPTNPAVISFATAIANWHGRNLVIGTGTQHNQFVKGTNRQSEHWTGNAADIPATGDDLTKLGQDALIAAGMPEAEARKKTGGVFNVNGYQVLFNTNTGGNHFNHLHVGVGKAKAPPVLPSGMTDSQDAGGATPLDTGKKVVFPFEDPQFAVPFEEPGSAYIGAPNRNYAETWKMIGSDPNADPLTVQYGGYGA